jgi:hypothetical protein
MMSLAGRWERGAMPLRFAEKFERPAARGCDAFAQSYVASDRIWREARRPLSPTALQATNAIYN